MLAARLAAARPEFVEHTVLRRLTRDEWAEVKSQNVIPWEGAICVLVLPPPNKDKATKSRPPPVLNDRPPDVVRQALWTDPPPLEMVQTCSSSVPTFDEAVEGIDGVPLPLQRLPLYHGLPLFPEPSHRAAIHDKLCQVLKVERNAKQRHLKSGDKVHSKWSHAFLLNSSAKTLLRADSVPLAIALWRLKLWEGNL